MTEKDFIEILKVPAIMGRGEAYGVIAGCNKFQTLYKWLLEENDPAMLEEVENERTILNMRMLITTLYPDTLFAVTRDEYETFRIKHATAGELDVRA
jgi:hypothetical protein